jgi:hypothetical protein
MFWREMDAICEGRPTKRWRRLEHAEDLPVQHAPQATA